MKQQLLMIGAAALAGCGGSPPPPVAPPVPHEVPLAAPRAYDKIERIELNRWAVRLNLPVYWIADANHDKRIEPDEIAPLIFYPTTGHWVDDGHFTPAFDAAYDAIVAAAAAPPPTATTDEAKRRALVGLDLDQGRPTLVRYDDRTLSADDHAFVDHMLTVAREIDELYAIQNGSAQLAPKVPADDPTSASAFRRNRGPRCVGPATEKDPLCSAIPGSPKPVVDAYPAELQSDAKFCAALEARKDAQALLGPFTVVRAASGPGAGLAAVSYADAYKPQMSAIAAELGAAADSMKDPAEGPLVTYLRAAAGSFASNDWLPADEAWSKMTVANSKWYVRVAPDEVYWEPCSHKAGFHLTFARINQGSIEWQNKLVPVQQAMEAAVAKHAGPPYSPRKVTFHLPDFIDIILNAGDDREPIGATIGQSLPNFGPVANGGRGRTVAMVNLYQDPDSHATRRAQAASVLDAASMAAYVDDVTPGLLTTILHEATHNLGPAHQYKVRGKDDGAWFGGPIASLYEELKAQTGGMFLVEFLRGRSLINDDLAIQTYTDAIVWAFGHISEGMYTGSGERKTYSQLAAIQIGFLIEHGALTWDASAPAANGTDTGAFTIHRDKLVPAIDQMMTLVAGIKARGDVAGAKALIAKYVDSNAVPQAMIAARFLRFPKGSFVYSLASMH